MPIEPENANSHRFSRLAKKLRNKRYRSTYLASHIKIFLANQISALRGSLSQEEFGKLLEKPQSVVSRLQNTNYGKYTLQTLLDIAAKMDLALIVRFVDYPTFLKITDNFSDRAVRPDSFAPEQVEDLAAIKNIEMTSSDWASKKQNENKQKVRSELSPLRKKVEGAEGVLLNLTARQGLNRQMTNKPIYTFH